MTTCACGIVHAPIDGGIEVRDPDDEIVAHGAFVHLERLDRHIVWLSITTPDGQRITVDFHARRRVRMLVQDQGDTPTTIPEPKP